MIRGILKDGLIYPLEPLPTEWIDGQELLVEESGNQPVPNNLSNWYLELTSIISQLDDAMEREQIEDSLKRADAESKDYVRREMGL